MTHASVPRALCALALLVLSACRSQAPVMLHAYYERGVPLPDLEITLLPFDAGRLLDSLEDAAETPRPDFTALETRLEAYRRTDTTGANQGDSGPSTAFLAVRDSVARLARELGRQDRRAPGYREAYARFRALYGRFTTRQAEHDAKARGLFTEDRVLASEATRASDSLRAWEAEAYRGFPALADSALARAGRNVSRVTTDSAGAATLDLPNGDWWAVARMPDPANPFLELAWSVPVTVRAGLPLSLPLLRANGERRWRH